ncbi:uncharacterized protein LOC100116895 isoform X1 [Nasonia vitripennis]|uniref:Uncharacterized protein n=1 Tax=Nasonia vitripennis TaxID=7425 RepID=A0A7M7Q2B6_NASVI|nr:uncharacterized protein LOC100116895 isoform X1 [Nasonia vitripennis]
MGTVNEQNSHVSSSFERTSSSARTKERFTLDTATRSSQPMHLCLRLRGRGLRRSFLLTFHVSRRHGKYRKAVSDKLLIESRDGAAPDPWNSDRLSAERVMSWKLPVNKYNSSAGVESMYNC